MSVTVFKKFPESVVPIHVDGEGLCHWTAKCERTQVREILNLKCPRK